MAEISLNNITLNITIDSDQFIDGGTYFLLLVAAIGFLVSILCMLYIGLKLVLNKFIKGIVFIMAFNNTFCFISMTVSTGVIIANNNTTELTCGFLIHSAGTIFGSTVIFIALLSVLR